MRRKEENKRGKEENKRGKEEKGRKKTGIGDLVEVMATSGYEGCF